MSFSPEKSFVRRFLPVLLVFSSLSMPAAFAAGLPFRKVMTVIFENADYGAVLSQPGFAKFARDGALLTNFIAEVHPSQGNYIALTAGDTYGVTSDNNVDLDVPHVGDLLEAKGKSWKIYLENYPGNCFAAPRSGTYVRKHNPFASFLNVTRNRARCNTHLVDARELDRDIAAGTVPDYSIYVPDLNNDGHDTGPAFANNWFSGAFGRRLQDSHFMQDLLVIATFDESSRSGGQHIYTAFYGSGVRPGSQIATRYDHYSLLKTIEVALGLGDLGRNDRNATVIDGLWNQRGR